MKNNSTKTMHYLSGKLAVTEILRYIFWIAIFTSLLLVSVHLRIHVDRIMADATNLQDKELKLTEENKKLEIEVENLKHPTRILNIATVDLEMVRDDLNEKLIISSKSLNHYKNIELEKVKEIQQGKGIKEFFLALLNITENAKAENK